MIKQQTLLDDRYRILGPLGCGGRSEVYLSRDELFGREVALKVLREQYASDEEFVERSAREARNGGARAWLVFEPPRAADGGPEDPVKEERIQHGNASYTV